MAGRKSDATILTFRLMLAGVVPYSAAKQAGIAKVYRGQLYALWKSGKHDELRAELDRLDALPPRKPKRKARARP